jgi:hypothetical protein
MQKHARKSREMGAEKIDARGLQQFNSLSVDFRHRGGLRRT